MSSAKITPHSSSLFTLLFTLLLMAAAGLLPHTATLNAQPAAPNLQCVNVLLSGNVQLTWAPGTGGVNCGATFTAYNIYVSNSASGPFTLLTAVTNALQTTFVDVTSNPTTTLYYYMETQCGGAVSAPSQTLDTQQPVAPVITTATVLDNSTVQLNWQPSTSPETAGYIIYRADANGNYIPIDTLLNPSATFYQDITAQPATQPQAYKIASFDACTNVTPGPDNGIPHQTVHLTAGTTDCLSEITLNWTKYRGWGTGISGYSLILVTANNVAISTIADVDTATTSFTYPIPEGETNACFRIVARRDNNIDIANSNFVCASIFIPENPDFICLTNVTVGQNDSVFLTWNIDTSAPLNGIRILRSQTDSAALNNYANYTLPAPISATMSYTDANTETRRFAYTYQIQHFNACNQNTYSGIAQTIRLRARDQFNLTNGLDWTPFYLTNTTLLNYNIYRSPINDNNYALLTTLPPTTLEFEDPLGQDSNVPGYCYRIEAIYQIACPGGFNDVLSSFSNTVCINQAPRIFVPNAFAPNGINNVFKPIILYPNAQGYLMQVMNRWGEIIYTTTNPDDGWDGNFKGQLAPQGVYAYYITMKTPIGITLERKGTVMLVR